MLGNEAISYVAVLDGHSSAYSDHVTTFEVLVRVGLIHAV